MKRLHLFEFEDQPWLPAFFRDSITDWLQQMLVLRFHFYAPTIPLLARLLESQRTDQVLDLCSGAGGPWPVLKGQLEAAYRPVTLTLTDKYPNRAAFRRALASIGDDRTDFRASSVDATKVPADLEGVRTMFTSFHHLPPALAGGVLRDAYENRRAIGVFEFNSRRLRSVWLSAVTGPFHALGTIPSVKPVSRWRLPFTYVVPVIPLLLGWDGLVSNLRAYTPDELRAMVADFDDGKYTWEIGRVIRRGPPLTYLIGYPSDS